MKNLFVSILTKHFRKCQKIVLDLIVCFKIHVNSTVNGYPLFLSLPIVFFKFNFIIIMLDCVSVHENKIQLSMKNAELFANAAQKIKQYLR